MIKVLMVIPSLAEKGSIMLAENIGKYTVDKNINIMYLSLRRNDESIKAKWIKNNMKFVEIGMKKIPNILDILKLKNIVKEYSPNAIHVHCFYPTILIALLNGKYKKMGKKVLL